MGVNMKNTNPIPQEQIFSIVLGFWQARALAVVTELGLPDLFIFTPLKASRQQQNSARGI
jgi:hypothetical protein